MISKKKAEPIIGPAWKGVVIWTDRLEGPPGMVQNYGINVINLSDFFKKNGRMSNKE